MARKRTGYLYRTKSGWRLRLTVDVDGEAIQKVYDLQTHDEQVAKVKARRLRKAGPKPTPAEAAQGVTLAEFAETWLARREAFKVAAAAYERRILTSLWGPHVGDTPLSALTTAALQDVIDAMAQGRLLPKPRKGQKAAPKPYARQSMLHARATMSRLLESARKLKFVTENAARDVEIPEVEQDVRARAILTDAELAQLIAHPEVDAEIKMLVLLSRSVGGLRSGDLNALDWTAFSPSFETCTFIRRKTRKKKPLPETHEVPANVRAFVAAWHQRNGSPNTGPVFPVRRGKRAGESKKAGNMSYADRLRRELLRAGVDRHELHHATGTTLPVDFHSTRRAYATAQIQAGLSEQQIMANGSWSDSKLVKRYGDKTLVKALPEAAQLRICTDHAVSIREVGNQNHNLAIFPERDTRFERATPSLGSSCSTN